MFEKLLYGDDIQWAMQRDELLRQAGTDEGLVQDIVDVHNMTSAEERLWYEIHHLYVVGYLCPRKDYGYMLTEDGKEFLYNGGYTGELKKSKNDIYAFRISVIAIIVALVSLLVSIWDHF